MSLQTNLGHEITPPFPPGEAITHLDGVVVISAVFIFYFWVWFIYYCGVFVGGETAFVGGGEVMVFLLLFPGVYLFDFPQDTCLLNIGIVGG